jgi:heme/copper-type cytochrome/quinol oxidase subunit 3
VTASSSSRLVPPELQAHDLVGGNLAVGIRLWAGATSFFFLGPFFAYLYLRSLNSVGQWRPAGIDPPQALGAATMALAVASSVALVLAGRAFGGAAHRRWLPLGWVALALGLGWSCSRSPPTCGSGSGRRMAAMRVSTSPGRG